MFIKTFFKNKRIMSVSVLSAGVRVTTVICLLITTAIATRKMTKEGFGLWAILISFTYMFAIFDFGFRYGVGNRLTALVAQAGGKGAEGEKKLFLSIFYFLGLIGIVLTLIYLASVPYIPWVAIFKIHEPALVINAHLLMYIVPVLLFLNVPFMLANSGFFAFQEVNLACIITACQSIILLVQFCITVFLLSFNQVIICYFITYLLTNMAGTAWFLIRRGWPLAWIPLADHFNHVKSLANRSLEFFVLSLSATVVATIGTFLAGSVAGLSKAGDFNLVQRIFGFVVTLHLALLTPLSPAFTKAARLGEWDSVQRKFSFCQNLIWPLLFLGGCSLIYLMHPIILKIWSGRAISNYTFVGLMALIAVLSGWGNTQSVLLNSLGLVKWQAIISVLMSPIFIFLPLYMGKTMGIMGVAAGTLICMIPGMIFLPIYARYALKRKLLRV